MDKKLIDHILQIDELAKKNVAEMEEKNKEVETYIKQEITAKEVALEVRYKKNILQFQQNLEDSFAKKEKEVESETLEKLNHKRNTFEAMKEENVNQIINHILKEVVSNNENNE